MNIFKGFNQKEIIYKINLIQGYVNDSKKYFSGFENYINNDDLSDSDKLICIKNQYLEFISNHSVLMKEK